MGSSSSFMAAAVAGVTDGAGGDGAGADGAGAGADGAGGDGGFTEAVALGGVAALAGVAAALPAYMVPALAVGVGEWPRTSSAKIDRRRLPPPEAVGLAGAAAAAAVVPPRTPAEAAARDAFAAVLGLAAEGVSVEASFFELGGNSLSAVRLARRLSEALGREVGVADVLQRPTAAALAAGEGGDEVPQRRLDAPEPLARRRPAEALAIAEQIRDA